MATLFELKDEILKGRRITRKAWESDFYEALGYFSASPNDIFADDWELEPLPKVKKKIIMYQYVCKYKQNDTFFITAELYKFEEEFKDKAKNMFIIDHIIILKAIPHEIEIDE